MSHVKHNEGRLMILVTSCLETDFQNALLYKKIEGRMEVLRRRRKRSKQLLDDHKKTTVYRKSKDEIPDRSLVETLCGRD